MDLLLKEARIDGILLLTDPQRSLLEPPREQESGALYYFKSLFGGRRS